MMIAQPQLPNSSWTLLEQPEQRLREQREHAVVGHELELRPVFSSCACSFGPTNSVWLNCAVWPGATVLIGPGGDEQVFLPVRVERVAVRRRLRRHDRADEVMLQRGDPAVLSRRAASCGPRRP